MNNDLRKEEEGILSVLKYYNNAWFTLQDIWIELQERNLFFELENLRAAAQQLNYEKRVIIVDGMEKYYKFACY